MSDTSSEPFTVLDGGPSIEEREARLETGADELADGRGRVGLTGRDNFLLAVAGAMMALGILVILIGWAGAANSTLVEEQIPYLISGGLLGVALTTVGALTLFSHWLTVSIREARAREVARRQDHREMMQALDALAGALGSPGAKSREEKGNGRARSARAQRSVR